MNRKPKKVIENTNKQYWEKRLIKIVEGHFEAAERRLPLFYSQELRNIKRLFWRNIKYTGLDFILLILNIIGLIVKILFKKTIVTKCETFTERYMRKRFDELVFHSRELEQKLIAYFKELDENIHSLIEDEIAHLRAKNITPEEYKKIIAEAIDRSTVYPDITKLVVVETIIPIFASYYFASKVTKGFGPVGIVVAQSYYWNQLSWYQRIWYKFPEWLTGSPYPFWLPIFGSIAGFLVGLFIAAPILNAIIDLILNLIFRPEKRIRKHLQKSRNDLLYTDAGRKQGGVVRVVFEKMNLAGEVLDYIKDLYLVVR